jgi:hypothetical protein
VRCQRRYSIALYHGTQTLLNVQATGRGVMQILGVQHAHLVPLLGKTRGQDVDKVRFLLSVQRQLALCTLTSSRRSLVRFPTALQLHELQSVHGMRLQERFGCMTLADCAGAVRFCFGSALACFCRRAALRLRRSRIRGAQFELTVVHSHDCGDHVLLTCDVGEATPAELACAPLTTGELRKRGII